MRMVKSQMRDEKVMVFQEVQEKMYTRLRTLGSNPQDCLWPILR